MQEEIVYIVIFNLYNKAFNAILIYCYVWSTFMWYCISYIAQKTASMLSCMGLRMTMDIAGWGNIWARGEIPGLGDGQLRAKCHQESTKHI